MPGPGATLITAIGELVTNVSPDGEPGRFAAASDAALVIEGDRVAWTGPASRAPDADAVVDAGGRAVLPGFVDSHAHLVFGGERGAEFASRMAGEPYTAGGIASTVAATRAATDGELRTRLARLTAEMARQGTTTFECKSGYGLTVADEARCVALAAEVTPEVTYLGAHVVPAEFAEDPDGYTSLVRGEMLDACAPHARWIDVFCERGAFDGDQARAILAAGRARGLLARVHANQLGPGPGAVVAAEAGAASADHCTFLTGADIDALASAGTVATLLPGAEFGTRQPYPDARRLLRAGVTVALATDCNPGSSYTSSMPFCVALAVRDMRMTTAEAVWSATAGGARALRRADVGYLAPGARADLIMLDAPSHAYLAYRPGVPLVRAVWRSGVPGRALVALADQGFTSHPVYDHPVADFDASSPSIARVYDYFLGGKDNFAVDREMGEKLLELYPRTADLVRESREFLIRAVTWVANQGISQFIDLGAGLPTEPSTQQTAMAVIGDARVAYVDNDPVAVSHLQALLANGNPGVTVVDGDVRDVDAILTGVAAGIDLSRPVCLIMANLLHFFPPDDAESLLGRYVAALVPGSYVIVSIAVGEAADQPPSPWQSAYRQAVNQVYSPTRDRVAAMLRSLEVVEPGIAEAGDWRPGWTDMPPPPPDGWGIAGAVARVP